MRMPKTCLALSLLATLVLPLCAQDTDDADDAAKKSPQFPSPDGQFAFRYGKAEPKAGADDEIETFDLIDAHSGKVLQRVAESDPNMGASARFSMEVLWKSDGKAFAVTAEFWKRGTTLLVFVRNGEKFRKVHLPVLAADITEKAKQGRTFAKATQVNSQTAKEWQKDGSLLVEIESTEDGAEGSITATRTVVLGFDKTSKARVLKSNIKFASDKE